MTQIGKRHFRNGWNRKNIPAKCKSPLHKHHPNKPQYHRREVRGMGEKRNASLTIYVDAATKTLHMFSGNFSVVLSADEAKYTIKLLNRLIQEW